MKLSSIHDERIKLIESLKKNNSFKVLKICSELYDNYTHFIYELIQNAEDAGAEEVSFVLTKEKLLVTHNGKPFTSKDVDSITSVGFSTKESQNTLGKFGIGFKSVFAVTETPLITSGNFCFYIKDFIVPHPVDCASNNGITTITIPFNHPKRNPKKVHKDIKMKLKSFECESLLFLVNIKKISCLIDDREYVYERSTVRDGLVSLSKNKKTAEYLVFSKKISISRIDTSVSIAYKIKKNSIIKANFTKLNVYFPTALDTNLNFILNIPFKTTPSRETVDFDDSENKLLLKKSCELYKESILKIKEMGYLKPKLMTILPFGSRENLICSEFCKATEDLFSSPLNELIPVKDGGFSSGDKVVIARDNIDELMTSSELSAYFRKKHFVDTSYADTLQDYLSSPYTNFLKNTLGISDFNFKRFSCLLTDFYLNKKSDTWMINFYKFLMKNNIPKKDYCNFPIVRLNDSSHAHLYKKNGTSNVYIGNQIYDSINFKVIKSELLCDLEVKDFFTDLGVKEPNPLVVFYDYIIPKYECFIPYVTLEEYLYDFKRILKAYMSCSLSTKEKFLSAIEGLNIFAGELTSQVKTLYTCKETYLYDQQLKEYFGDNTRDKCFIDRSFSTLLGKNFDKIFKSLCCELDISIRPKLLIDSTPRKIKTSMDGLFEAVNSKSHTRVLLAFKYLSQLEKPEIHSLKYDTVYYGKRKGRVEHEVSGFTDLLTSTPWIIGDDGELYLPANITKNQLHPKYKENNIKLDTLCKLISFKLLQEDRTLTIDEYEEYLMLKALYSNAKNEIETQNAVISDKQSVTGKKGELYVYNLLKSQYSNIGSIEDINDYEFICRSHDGDIIKVTLADSILECNQGYDILIEENGAFKYIEVKSSIGSITHIENLTPAQIFLAMSEEDNFFLYVVSNLDSMPHVEIFNDLKDSIIQKKLVPKKLQLCIADMC